MLSRATQIPDKTSKSFIVGSCIVGLFRYKCRFACFIPGSRGATDTGNYRAFKRAGDLLGGLLGKDVLCEQWSIRGGENAG
jgi:hypothetical protein